ncbi:MAG: hypothetical protein Q9167_006371 [Letrouitia subvulpina]
MAGQPVHRPLAELGPTERRRNSPSYNQNTKKDMFGGDSSPFDSPPYSSNSPRLYWQKRDGGSPTRFGVENQASTESHEATQSPRKRSSLENLKRASRVKNSNMFAREHKNEYDPSSSPLIERPLASGRPLSNQVQGNAYGGRGLEGFKNDDVYSKSRIPMKSPPRSPPKMGDIPSLSHTANRTPGSPSKSSLSSKSRYAQAQVFDPENGIWSDEDESSVERKLPPGKSLHRYAKSVTFDAAPPQVNEYEMTTPDPSSVASGSREGSYESTGDEEEEDSFNRDSSVDRDDSFDASLEDTEKTPVVLPEDWRFMSPANANDDLAARVEDPFEGENGSPVPTTTPSSAVDARLSPTRTDSGNSNGERRPLPPLPALGVPSFPRARSDSNSSLSATIERASSAQRGLPSLPRPASVTKSEIHGMEGSTMALEDRLRLMMIQDEAKPRSPEEEQRERRLRRGHSKSPERESFVQESGIQIHEREVEKDDIIGLGEYKLPPRISRESILRKVKSQRQEPDYEGLDYGSPPTSPIVEQTSLSNIDPDVPLPSLELEQTTDELDTSVFIKPDPESEENDFDVYSIPELYSQQLQAESYMNAIDKLEDYAQRTDHGAYREDDDDQSLYSTNSKGEHDQSKPPSSEDESIPTPRAPTPQPKAPTEHKESRRMSLPQFASMLGQQDFGFGLESFMTPSPPISEEPVKTSQPVEIAPEVQTQNEVSRPFTPELQIQLPKIWGHGTGELEEPRTPDSVIRHPVANSPAESPSIPEPAATIKAPGSKLKTRPSITPADVRAMAETRRQVSGEIPDVPPIPARHQNRPSIIQEASFIEPEQEPCKHSSTEADVAGPEAKQSKRKSSLVQLDLPKEGSDGLGLDREFDRLIEVQKVALTFPSSDTDVPSKSTGYAEYIAGQGFTPVHETVANTHYRTQKGYLMRQNTKVVVASSASGESVQGLSDADDGATRGTRSAGNSPRKPSQTKSWTTEPWNGKIRRKSIRQSGGSPQKVHLSDPVPPLPGQQSNVTSGLDSVPEDDLVSNLEDLEEGAERGRLFVKVLRVKDLDLPLPRDNGLHCVTTSWLELGKTAPIGQEFELVVLNDLEFQLTLQTKIEEPKPKPAVESPTKLAYSPKKSTFSRVFASPKKRKEMELKEQEAQRAAHQRQLEAQANRRSIQPTAWELLHKLVAKDGSFARSYVCLKDHESNAFGRAYTVDVPCFNEWAMEDISASVKSKRSAVNGGVQRRAPYRIGKLELQLLYVPKPKDAKDEDMPKSMNACIRELKEAEASSITKWEGHLSQQGGDCPYWRRRFFMLDGCKFTAYHEATRQPRATINLTKASKLIDDKSALMKKDASAKSGARRKSAFAEEEEGYMFVEEGFRIRFANGETIDFYADSAGEKDGWMRALSEVVGKDLAKPRSWTDIVIARQRAAASRAAKAQQASPTKAAPTRSAPPTPAKTSPTKTFAPPPVSNNPRNPGVGHRRPDAPKTRSMIF